MKTSCRTILIVIGLLAILGVSAPVHADRYRGHGPSHHYGHHDRHGYVRGGFYAPLYWGGYGYGPGYWGPAWPSLGLGYAWGGRHDSFGLSLSLPLYFGSRYDPYPPPPRYRTYRYVEVQPAVRTAPATACRQTREYTTEVTIGDQVLPAYGTACLQADGSWKIISGPIIAEK